MRGMQNTIKSLPSGICEWRELRTVLLDVNAIAELPHRLYDLSSLQMLNLSGNKLKQIVPTIGQLRSVEDLLLNDNPLVELPDEIGQVVSCCASDTWCSGLTQRVPRPGKHSDAPGAPWMPKALVPPPPPRRHLPLRVSVDLWRTFSSRPQDRRSSTAFTSTRDCRARLGRSVRAPQHPPDRVRLAQFRVSGYGPRGLTAWSAPSHKPDIAQADGEPAEGGRRGDHAASSAHRSDSCGVVSCWAARY